MRERPKIYRQVVRLLGEGWSANKICKWCHVTRETVRAVESREAAEISARKKSIIGILSNVAELRASRMEETIGKASLRDAAIGTEIAVDKMLALTGQTKGRGSGHLVRLDDRITVRENVFRREMRQCEICTVAKRGNEVSNNLPIPRRSLARSHLLFHVEPVRQPIASLVTVKRLARRTLQNFADDFFRGLLSERTVVFGAINRKTEFQGFRFLVSGSFKRAVFALFALEGLDCDLGRFLQPLTSCARVAANPEGRTSAGVFPQAWHSHNKITTFANVNDVVTCLLYELQRIESHWVNLFRFDSRPRLKVSPGFVVNGFSFHAPVRLIRSLP